MQLQNTFSFISRIMLRVSPWHCSINHYLLPVPYCLISAFMPMDWIAWIMLWQLFGFKKSGSLPLHDIVDKKRLWWEKVLNRLICLYGVKSQEKDSFFELTPNQWQIRNEGSSASVLQVKHFLQDFVSIYKLISSFKDSTCSLKTFAKQVPIKTSLVLWEVFFWLC